MRLEIFILGLTAFFIYNAYQDGKYTKMLLSFKKYYKMIFYAILGVGIYLLLKRNRSLFDYLFSLNHFLVVIYLLILTLFFRFLKYLIFIILIYRNKITL